MPKDHDLSYYMHEQLKCEQSDVINDAFTWDIMFFLTNFMFSNSTELPTGAGGMRHLTHICKCGKGPKVADTHQAEDKPFPSLN